MIRRRFSEREVIQPLILQGVRIECFRCHAPFDNAAHVEREHIVELALGGADEPRNCVYSCGACHHRVTNGGGATTAGSSKHRIAKARGTRSDKFVPVKQPLDLPREKRDWRRKTFERERSG